MPWMLIPGRVLESQVPKENSIKNVDPISFEPLASGSISIAKKPLKKTLKWYIILIGPNYV